MSSAILTPAWTAKQWKPHKIQSRVWRTKARFVALCAGRGSGKTALSFRRLVRFLPVRKPWDNPQYFYGAPTREQAKRLAWDELLLLIPPDWIKSKNETELVIETIFGSSLHLVSLEKPQRIEGTQWDGGVLDESSDGKPGIFSKTVIPALTHRNGWCWRIGVPKRHGAGAREFREFFDRGLLGIDPLHESYSWPSWDILSEREIEEAKTQLGNIDFLEQFGGNWQSPEGQIYYGFSKDRNVDDEIAVYNPNEKIYVGSDFNVSPMAWTIAHKINGRALVFDELYLMNTNTPRTLDALYARYPNHKAGWRFIGDATGKARKTSATHSDYVLIKNDQRFENKEVRYPDSNPAVGDRFACVNANCSNGRVIINSKCKNLVDDLEACAYKEGSREQDKSNKFEGHITDALGYFLVRELPIRLKIDASQKGIGIVKR